MVFIFWVVWLVVVLVVSVLIVDNLVVMVMLVVFDVIPDLECTGQSVDCGDDEEFGHEQSLDHHQQHLYLLLDDEDTEQDFQEEFLDLLLDLLFLVCSSFFIRISSFV
uniref:Uncharacterized protein n=1 Tax=Cacopsylla melanoneura TaxID=428564 RepID=A0A8D8Z8U4_9HEMI